MSDATILCYLDVLGYSDLVRKHYADTSVREGIERILQSSIGHLKDLKERGTFHDPALEEYAQQVFNTLRIRFVSDSIIYTLDLTKFPPVNTDAVAAQPVTFCVRLFFQLISAFCTTLIAKTGLVVRGGITIGSHYERDWEEDGSKCLFVFSKALVDAVDLEKNVAKTARIVIDESLLDYLREKADIDIDAFVFKDTHGRLCFEVYNILRLYSADSARRVLKAIRHGVTSNMADCSDQEALEKLKYFAEYHNSRMKASSLNDLLIG